MRFWVPLVLGLTGLAGSAARAGVYLSSYNFTLNTLPTIYTDEPMAQPYKLRAKFQPNYHGTDLFNNNGLRLQSVPGAGTYTVELYWVKYGPDGTSIIGISPEANHQTVTIQSSSNPAPTIQWTSSPATASEGQAYFIDAMGSDANGNLTAVSVWKQEAPFAFAGGGDGWTGYSGNPSVDSGGQSITFHAQARDAGGATSAVIYHTVYINKKPTVWWDSVPNVVDYDTPYYIRARAQDDDGNLTEVKIYRTRNGVEEPFAFELNGTQSEAYADNPDYAFTYNSTTYRAEAIDASGARSGSIYHTVYVTNYAPNAAWSSTMPNTTVLPSLALQVNTFIGQTYHFAVSGSDPDGNLKEVRTYEYAWEDVSGNWVERKHFQHFDTVTTTGGPVSRPYSHVGGLPWKWNYSYVAIASDVAGSYDNPVGDNILNVHLDNRNPAPPTLTATHTTLVVGQTVLLGGAGFDPDQNATQQWLWYRGPDQGPTEWIQLTRSSYPGGTANTVVNFSFSPEKPGTYYFKTQVNDPYSATSIVDVSPLTVLASVVPPNAPTNLMVAGTAPTWVYLTWTHSNSASVAEQHAYWEPLGGGPTTDIVLNVNITGVSVANLTPGGAYRFYLKARDGSGNYSARSNEVTVTTPIVPVIISSPRDQTVLAGDSAILTVSAAGSAPLYYQWQKNGINLANGGRVSGADSATLVLSSVQGADTSDYRVAVSNAGGAVMSDTGTLTVLYIPPSFAAQPMSQTVAPGQTAIFTVVAAGSAPLFYQWHKDGVLIAGATSATYTIAAVQPSDAANAPGYVVVLTNGGGSAASDSAVLTVNTTVDLTSGLVSWWKFDDGSGASAADSAGPNPGTITAPTWGPGRIGTNALSFNGATSYVDLGSAPSLNLAGVNRFTLSAWIYPTSVPTGSAIISESYNGGDDTSVQYQLGFDVYGATSKLSISFYNPADGDWHIATDSTDVALNTWTSIAGTWDGATLRLFRNGLLVGSSSTGGSLPAAGFGQVRIGRRYDNWASTNAFYMFPGLIDDVRVYSRALSPMDALGLHDLGSPDAAPAITAQPLGQSAAIGGSATFSVMARGIPAPTFQWHKDGVPIIGANNSTYSIVGVQAADAGTYSVLVSNSHGAVLSSEATLAVEGGADIASNLVSRWKLDEGTGATAGDSVGGNSGFVSSPAWSGGRVGSGSLQLDGQTAYLDLGAPATLNLSAVNRFTLSAWVYPTAAPTGSAIISEAYDGSSDSTVQYQLGFDVYGATSRLSVAFYNPDDGGWHMAVDSSDVEVNAWTFVAGTWDGTTLRLYKNGALVASSTSGGALPAVGYSNVRVGRRYDNWSSATATYMFPGSLDDVRIYSRALSAADVAALHLFTETPGELGTPIATPASLLSASGFTANWSPSSGATGYRVDVSSHSDFSIFLNGFQDLNVGSVTSLTLAQLPGNTAFFYRVRAHNGTLTSDNSNTVAVTTRSAPAGDSTNQTQLNIHFP